MIGSVGKAGALAGLFGGLAIHRSGTWSWQGLYPEGVTAASLVFLAYLFVSVMVPAGLPWWPGRAFSIKGACAGFFAWALLWAAGLYGRVSELTAWLALFMVMGSFMGLNFTGASTYTSLSGVKKETRLAVPAMVTGLLVSMGLWSRACGIW
jgi:acetyl-CoA decarbonylase/synthase complex subunit gamma